MGRIKGRPSKYRKGLQEDEQWQEARRKVKIRDCHQCRICTKKIGLEIHHITYYVDGESIRGKELSNMQWLITLCSSCHKNVHADPDHKYNPSNKKKVSS